MTKPDPLTPEERAEVNARIAARAVTVLPLGASTAVLPVWDGHRLVMPADAPHGFRVSMNRFQGADAAPRRRHKIKAPDLPAHVVRRREQVAALHAKGATIPEIVAALQGVTNWTIRNDLLRLGLEANPCPGTQKVDHKARARHIRKLAKQGLTAQQIADVIGIHIDSIRKLAKDLRLKLARQRRSDAGGNAMQMAAE